MFKIHDNMYKVIVILLTVIYSIAIQLLRILGLYTVRCSERIRVLYKIQSYRQLSIFIPLYFIQNPYSQGNYSSKKWTPLSSTLKSFCQVFAILNGTTIHSRITLKRCIINYMCRLPNDAYLNIKFAQRSLKQRA